MTEVKPTLAEALADVGIRPLHWRAGIEQRLICPSCDGGSTREKSLALRLDEDGGAVWTCHRGKCGWVGNVPAGTVKGGVSRAAPARRVQPIPAHQGQTRTDQLYDYFAKRGISRETVDAFGVYLLPGTHFPQQEKDEAPLTAIVFPYLQDGELVNHKYRGYRWVDATGDDGVTRRIRQKIHKQDTGAPRTIFNIDALVSEDVVIWLEGEPDTLAAWEAGYRQVITLPDGTPEKLRAEDDPRREHDKRYIALEEAKPFLQRIKKHIIASDNDQPGHNHAEEIARRIGKDRCWRVSFPADCKDVNDVLMKYGPDALRDMIEDAQPWPREGIKHGISAAELASIRGTSRPDPLTTGLPSLDTLFKLPQHGALVVMTGAPGNGKSSLFNAIIVQAGIHHKWHSIICSPEMGHQDTAAYMASIKTGTSFFIGEGLKPWQVEDAAQFLRDHVTFLDLGDRTPTLDWIIRSARDVHAKRRSKMLVLDPAADIDWITSDDPDPQTRRDETARRSRLLMPKLYDERLSELRNLARELKIVIVVVAHPHMMKRDRDGKYPTPTGYDISGGAPWFGKAEVGLTIERLEGNEVRIICWKARHRLYSAMGDISLRFEPTTGRFFDTVGGLSVAGTSVAA